MTALSKLESNGSQKTHKVIFRVDQADVLPILGSRYCVHRLSGQVLAKNIERGVTIFDVHT